MSEGNVDTVAWRPVYNPRRKTETTVRRRCVDRAIARFRCSDPALLVLGGYDRKPMSRDRQGGDQFAKENAVNTVVVGDQKMHTSMAPRSPPVCKRGIPFRLT